MMLRTAIIIFLICAVGLCGDYLWVLISKDFWYACVRTFALLSITLCWIACHNWYLRKFVEFTWGFALYGVIKELFLYPLSIDVWEYSGMGLGVIVLLIQMVRGK